MGLFLDLFNSLKRVMTGEVILQLDTPANAGRTVMSLRLKKPSTSDDLYVVLGGISPRNYEYFSFSKEEFLDFADSVEIIRTSLIHGRPVTGQDESRPRS